MEYLLDRRRRRRPVNTISHQADGRADGRTSLAVRLQAVRGDFITDLNSGLVSFQSEGGSDARPASSIMEMAPRASFNKA